MDVNEITLYRGNTVYIELNISISSEPYTLRYGDTIEFAVKSSTENNAKKLIGKILTNADYDENNKLTIEILPSDTLNLQPYTYYYDVGLTMSDGSFYTVIPPSKFTVLPTITEVITS